MACRFSSYARVVLKPPIPIMHTITATLGWTPPALAVAFAITTSMASTLAKATEIQFTSQKDAITQDWNYRATFVSPPAIFAREPEHGLLYGVKAEWRMKLVWAKNGAEPWRVTAEIFRVGNGTTEPKELQTLILDCRSSRASQFPCHWTARLSPQPGVIRIDLGKNMKNLRVVEIAHPSLSNATLSTLEEIAVEAAFTEIGPTMMTPRIGQFTFRLNCAAGEAPCPPGSNARIPPGV
jgi:hypothetical protein